MDVIEERNIVGVINRAQYMEINDIHSFELERDDIEFVRLLGNGNFGEVFKANMGHVTVAVKSLKGKINAISLDTFLSTDPNFIVYCYINKLKFHCN